MKYRAIITFPQGVIFEHYDHRNGHSSSTTGISIILSSNDFRKIKSRGLQICEKYNAGWIEIFNMHAEECLFFSVNKELNHISNPNDDFTKEHEELAFQYFSKYPKVIIKNGKLGYSKNGWSINLDV